MWQCFGCSASCVDSDRWGGWNDGGLLGQNHRMKRTLKTGPTVRFRDEEMRSLDGD